MTIDDVRLAAIRALSDVREQRNRIAGTEAELDSQREALARLEAAERSALARLLSFMDPVDTSTHVDT
jgi:hypothetical protein